MFIIYINDIDSGIVSSLSKLAELGEHALRIAPRVEYVFTQQDHLNQLYGWSSQWHVLFNASKYHCRHVGYNNPKYDYFMGDQLIETTIKEKYLGVHIHSPLPPAEHIAHVVIKSNRQLDAIRRTYTNKSMNNILQFYQRQVRPHREYSLQVWNPRRQKDIQKIEELQRRAPRMIAAGTKRHDERLRRCKMLSLEDRRIRGDLIETFKIINGYTEVDPELLFEIRDGTQQSRSCGQQIMVQHTHLEVRRNFVSQRVINLWNYLPLKQPVSTPSSRASSHY